LKKVEIITRRMCGGCQDLKRRLAEAGIEFTEYDADTADGMAVWAWYGAPSILPAVVVDGCLLPSAGDVLQMLGDKR